MFGIYHIEERQIQVEWGREEASGQLVFSGPGINKSWSPHWLHKKLAKQEGHYILQYKDGQEGRLILDKSAARELILRFKSEGLYMEGVSGGNVKAVRVLLLILIPVIIIPVWLYIFGIDWMAQKAAHKMPVDQEISIGKTIYETTLREYPEVDHRRSLLVDSFYHSLGFPSLFPVKITVVKSPEINAFALPGGNIFIMTGLLDKIDSAGVLAALLSHEVSHINERHAARGLFRQAGAYLLISSMFGDVDATGIGMTENLKSLSYSRSMEEEADQAGFKLMVQCGKFHPRGLVQLFVILEKVGEQTPPAFLSTHPDTKDRKKQTEEALKNLHWVQKDTGSSAAIFQLIQQKQ